MKNKYEIRGEITVIFLVNRKRIFECLIDTDDLEKANSFPNTWVLKDSGYVCGKFKGKEVSIHRFLTDAPADMVVDHIEHNKLDNRRKTMLRIVNYSVNNQNKRGACVDSLTQVRNVTWNKRWKRWDVCIVINGKCKYFGGYKDLGEADRAAKAARALFMEGSKEFRSMNKEDAKKNIYNRRKFPSKIQSGIRGISWNSNDKTWIVTIGYKGKAMYLGRRKDIEDAKKLLEKGREKISELQSTS